MSCQINTETYSLACRCPLSDAERLKTLSDKNGVTMSAFVAMLIHKAVSGVVPSAVARALAEMRRKENIRKRQQADTKTARGDYRTKRNGVNRRDAE